LIENLSQSLLLVWLLKDVTSIIIVLSFKSMTTAQELGQMSYLFSVVFILGYDINYFFLPRYKKLSLYM
jgi:hypothetical protein